MKQKILWWQGRELTYFGIAKYFQEKYDCDNYAIIEIRDKPKKFFEKQKIIKFKKVWYFYDEIFTKKEKPDINYLTNFEKKYSISLWKTAYADRSFYGYNDYHKFSSEEILIILEAECKFYEKILDEIKPDFLICKLTDFHDVNLLYQLCKAKGIKILMSSSSMIGNRIILSQDSNRIDPRLKSVERKSVEKTYQELKNYLDKNNSLEAVKRLVKNENLPPLYKPKAIISVLRILLSSGKNNDRERFLNKNRTRKKIFIKSISFFLRKKLRRKFIEKKCLKKIPHNEKIIFLGLHDEPERTTLIAAPFFTNQLEIIRRVAKSIPIDYLLYVKEHPALELRGWRKISYYKQILNLHNVRLVHPSVSSRELIKKSDLIITIAGTLGLEAVFFRKPSLIFSDQNYIGLPSVSRIKNLNELPQIIRDSLNYKFTKTDLVALNEHVDIIETYAYGIGNANLRDEFWPFYGLVASNAEISDKQMENYIIKHKDEFELLADQHIKRLKHFDLLQSNES